MRWLEIALVMGTLVGCGGSSDPPASTTSGGSTGAGSTGAGGSDGTSYLVTPAVCGGQGEPCCESGALCGAGLTCSDSCLRCGAAPVPAPLSGCTNVARGAAPSAGSFGTGPGDDPAKVVDDDVCTSWNYGSYADANSRWQVDLGRAYPLQGLTLWPKMTPSKGTVQFLIEYKVAETDPYVAWPTSGGLALTLYDYQPWQTTFSPMVTARYFRVTIQGTPSFAALREVGLYTACASGT